MNAWQALYVKELKDNRGIFAFLLAAAVCLGGYALVQALMASEPVPGMALAAVPFFMALVYPFLLTHSFSQEMRSQTHFLLLSLPLPRWQLVMAKFAAVLTGSAALFIVSTALGHAVLTRLVVLATESDAAAHSKIFHITGGAFWAMAASGYFSITVLLLGAATLVAAVKLVVHRFQGILSAVTFGLSMYVYVHLLGPAINLMGPFGTLEVAAIEHTGGRQYIEHVAPEMQVLIYSCAMGLLFLGLGAWIIEKRVEA